uniref:Uncharacterized protein n=1 Tax=Arundo donax TaxID=35708 RepID=A0A0A9A2P7_ARUDO
MIASVLHLTCSCSVPLTKFFCFLREGYYLLETSPRMETGRSDTSSHMDLDISHSLIHTTHDGH